MQRSAIDDIRSRYESNRLPHAILVSGGTASSRDRFATEAAMMIFAGDAHVRQGTTADAAQTDLQTARGTSAGTAQTVAQTAHRIAEGNFADLIDIVPDGGSIKVDAIKELIEKLRYRPFEARCIMAVIHGAERMNPQAQNKLLKTLEEPAGENVIILLTSNAAMLRPTIRSRCLNISVHAEPVGTDSDTESDAKAILSAVIFGKPVYEAFALLDKYCTKDVDTEAVFLLLDAMEYFIRDLMVGRYDEALVADAAHRDLAVKMRSRRSDDIEAGVYIIEDTRQSLRLARMNRKNCLHDMAVRIRDRRNQW